MCLSYFQHQRSWANSLPLFFLMHCNNMWNQAPVKSAKKKCLKGLHLNSKIKVFKNIYHQVSICVSLIMLLVEVLISKGPCTFDLLDLSKVEGKVCYQAGTESNSISCSRWHFRPNWTLSECYSDNIELLLKLQSYSIVSLLGENGCTCKSCIQTTK